MKLIINNNIYDISTFINEHPGGAEVFQRESNINGGGDVIHHDDDNECEIKDYTEKFNDVGHSEYAINLIENYKISELSEDDSRFNREHRLRYNKNKISKLITHEDKFHIHKIMGLISLLNYAYLLGDCIYSGAQATLTLREIDGGFIGMTWVHSVLSLSALQFLIPRSRTGILPMIWQEFRAHSIIFAVRSFFLINVLYVASSVFNVDANNMTSSGIINFNMVSQLIRTGVVLLSMKMADLSTVYLRENKKETTTATMPYWSGCPAAIQSTIKYFYMHSQFMATFVCLYGNVPYILAVAFPIQFASFMMTLVRKNIISSFLYHALYGGSLAAVYMINAADVKLYSVIIVGALLIYLRVQMRMNKYILWTLVGGSGFIVHCVSGGNATTTDATQSDISFIRTMVALMITTMAGLISSKFTKTTGSGVVDIKKYIFDTVNVREESNHRVLANTPVQATATTGHIRDDSDTNGNCNGNTTCKNNLISIKLCESFPNFKPGMYFNLFFDNKKRPYSPIEYVKKSRSPNMKCADTDADIIKFLIKRVDNGEVSPNICDKYLVNNTIFLKGPFGRKYYDPSPNVKSFVCDGKVITSKHIVMCSCGSGITPFYSMGLAWAIDNTTITATTTDSNNNTNNNNNNKHNNNNVQRLHFLSSYANSHDALLTKTNMIQTAADSGARYMSDAHDDIATTDTPASAARTHTPEPEIFEKLFLSNEKNKLTPSFLIDYINELNLEINDVVVFTCGTHGYCRMVKDCCAITSVACYEW